MCLSPSLSQKAQRSKKFNLARNFQSRSKFLISLENFNLDVSIFPTKIARDRPPEWALGDKFFVYRELPCEECGEVLVTNFKTIFAGRKSTRNFATKNPPHWSPWKTSNFITLNFWDRLRTTKNRAAVGGSLENFILARNLECFCWSLGPLGW